MKQKIRNKERYVYSSPNIIRVIKSRRIRWTETVARTGLIRAYKILIRKPEGDDHLGEVQI